MPTDIVSFTWGIIVAAVAIIATGVLKAAGSDLYNWVKSKINPPSATPVQVERNFQPENGKSCAWVTDEKLLRLESEGYTFYLHPTAKARCFRLVRSGNGNQFKEWLLIKPQ